jgi:hypothetical protein
MELVLDRVQWLALESAVVNLQVLLPVSYLTAKMHPGLQEEAGPTGELE